MGLLQAWTLGSSTCPLPRLPHTSMLALQDAVDVYSHPQGILLFVLYKVLANYGQLAKSSLHLFGK